METTVQHVLPEQLEQSASTHFSCLAPDNYEVFLAGTFNDWNPKSTPMIKVANGSWNVDVPLLPGRYEFKFVVDGKWCCDPGCGCNGPDHCRDKCVPNEFGTMNRELEVS